jgi:hypothetical protein
MHFMNLLYTTMKLGFLKSSPVFMRLRIYSLHTAAGRYNLYLLYFVINLQNYGIILPEYWHSYALTACVGIRC